MLNMIKKAAHLANQISQNNPQTSDFATAQQTVLDTCIQLADKGYLAGIGGNIALRIDDKHFAVTPSAADYYSMTADDICILTLDDLTPIHAPKQPSVEAGLHAKVFATRPDCTISVHTHQPIASSVALIGDDIHVENPNWSALLGRYIRLVNYAPSGTGMLVKALGKTITADNNAYLLKNHGVVVMANDVATAIAQVEAVEKAAAAHLRALILKKHGASPQDKLAKFALAQL